MRSIAPFRFLGAVGSVLALASLTSVTGCFDDEPVPAPHTGASTVVVSKPGVTSPQPTVIETPSPQPQSAPPIINNVVQPSPSPVQNTPAPVPAPQTTVNVQPRNVTVP
jgi:hypothetical protein